jgi:hypothetical protein
MLTAGMAEAPRLATVKDTPPIVPLAPTAIPAEVRTYFADILTTHYHVPATDAEKLVQAWHYGTGATFG